MRSLVIFVSLISWAEAQNGRGPQYLDHNGHGWDIRLAVPGEPGNDYPTLGAIPRTSFSCAGREPGYYADLQTGCQVFRVCTLGSTYGFQSFLCPNGTLFNQAVFVCDWWMNVNCESSEQLSTNEKFENLRLGPQLMKDIKKMLTHPVRNPYDKTAMKSDQIVMQEYKPPIGQLFPNGALLAGPDRTPNNIYVPAKQQQQNLLQNVYSTIATPDPKYIPSVFNTNQYTLQRDTEVFQRQRQNDQYVQNDRIQSTPQTGNINSNGHAGQFTENKNINYANNNEKGQLPRPTPNYNQRNLQFSRIQSKNSENIHTANTQNIQRGQFNRERLPYTINMKQNEFREPIQQYNFNSNQEKQPYTYKPPTPQFISELVGDVGNQLKQNLVSTNVVPSTVVTKTITYSRIVQDPKPGKPKSRITVKTWIAKPSKASKLVVSPTSYYSPTPSTFKKIVEETTPYVYNRPTIVPVTETTISKQELNPYVNNKPTVPLKQVTTNSSPSRLYLSPTPTSTPNLRLTLADRIYSIPTSPPPTKASPAYFAPTTFKPAARLYLPPSDNPEILSLQYLSPNTIQQPVYPQSEQLRATSTIPKPTYVTSNQNLNSNKPFSPSTQLHNNVNPSNIIFSDILTKDKLDITVNDIVKDTGSVLKTSAPPQYGQYKENIKFVDHLEDNYLPPETDDESGENLTSQSPTIFSKSAKIIAKPVLDLEPPIESYDYENTNQLSKLLYFKEPPLPNTIERTVSLKITIPEKLAKYLFKGRKQDNFDKLEILSTGSSNYLVLSNNLFNQNAKNMGNFIPLGKLVDNNDSNFSTSQALVFSFLADSINAANEYSNVAKQDALSSTPTVQQFQNLNNEDLTHITNKISQLTSSQFTKDDNTNINRPIIASTAQTTSTNYQENQFRGTTTYPSNQEIQAQKIKAAQSNVPAPTQQTQDQYYPSQYQNGNNVIDENILNSNNQNQIYSGQLYQYPVPDVTSKIYNRPQPATIVSHQITQSTSQQATNQNNSAANNNNFVKQSRGELEIVPSQTSPLNPAKLQMEPTNEPESFYSQESLSDLLNGDNGISAQLQDKIVGTIPHPLEGDKLLTYEKDQSYYLYTKLENNRQNFETNGREQVINYGDRLNAKFTPNRSIPNVITFQFVPSEGYELENDKYQQKINAFQTNDFNAARNIAKANLVQNDNQRQTVTTNMDYSVGHSTSDKQVSGQYNPINALYNGPSSYSAPQSSVGSLELKQIPISFNSRLEQLNDNQKNIGYLKEIPARQFSY